MNPLKFKMGNNNSNEFTIIDENKEDPPNLPKINPFHPKGKPYGVLLDRKLKGKHPNGWAYYHVYDLRNGKSIWHLQVNIYGDELQFEFDLVRKNGDKEEVYFKFPLHYSSQSINYMTILKGKNERKCVELELYADNIHSQKLENLKLENSFKIYGFIKFDKQDKIPIAF